MNGNRLVYSIMGALFAILVTVFGVWATALDTGQQKFDERMRASEIDRAGIRYQIQSLHEDMCRMERKIDDIREELTGKSVYRTPCP